MNYTANHQLPQWVETDRIMMEDFNAAMANIEAGLTARDPYALLVPYLAHYVGMLVTKYYLDTNATLGQRAIISEAFIDTSLLTLSGEAAITDGMLVVSGTGATGTMTAANLGVNRQDWTEARLWVHCSRPNGLTAKLNGEEMTLAQLVRDNSVVNPTFCWLHEFVWTGTGGNSAQFRLEMDCGTASDLTVYDYCAVFI